MEVGYNIDYFIKKFLAITPKRWAMNSWIYEETACALGHCGMKDSLHYTEESKALLEVAGATKNQDGYRVSTITSKNDNPHLYGYKSAKESIVCFLIKRKFEGDGKS